MSRFRNYKPIVEFGCQDDKTLTTNPFQLALSNTPNKSFDNGVNAYYFNPNNKYSQEFMAQYCASNWDNMCELASNSLEPTVNAISKFSQTTNNQTLGENTIRNSAVEKYCDLYGCNAKMIQLNPIDSTSPYIRQYEGNCVPVCMVNPETIENDPIMNKMLNDPYKYMDIITNIYHNNMRNGVDLRKTNTRLGDFLRHLNL